MFLAKLPTGGALVPRLQMFVSDLSATGVVRNALAIANQAAATGFDVRLLTCSADGVLAGDLDKRVTIVELLDGSRSGGSRRAQLKRVFLAYRRHSRDWRPDILFSTQNGIGPMMGSVDDVERLADEEVSGRPTFHLQAQVDESVVGPLTYQTLTSSPITVDLWIDQENYDLLQARLAESPSEEKPNPAIWTFGLSHHDVDVEIEPPEPAASGIRPLASARSIEARNVSMCGPSFCWSRVPCAPVTAIESASAASTSAQT